MDDAAKGRWRFRLVELVVVIGVLGLLAAMAVSSVQRSREAGRRSQCANNLKYICFAILNYEQQQKVFPPGMIYDKGEDPALTDFFRPNWLFLTVPYIESTTLQRSLDCTVSICDARNRIGRGTLITATLCPSDMPNNREPFDGTSTGEGDNWARGNCAVNAGNVYIGTDGVTGASSAQWKDDRRRGVTAVNDATMDLAGIRDGIARRYSLGRFAPA